MGRIINTDSTGKTRSRLMRSCAELLRHLGQKQNIDAETKDMAACMVLCLREIETGIDDSAEVWEKRDYWMKAEQLRQRWDWVSTSASKLENLIRSEAWHQIPEFLMGIVPRFASIKVTRMTRSSDLWNGAYEQLLKEER